jgi:hypothetical protein
MNEQIFELTMPHCVWILRTDRETYSFSRIATDRFGEHHYTISPEDFREFMAEFEFELI